MADQTPMGAIISFGGVAIASLPGVHDIGFPSLEPTMVEAYAQTLGSAEVVDLLNGTDAPRKDVFTCDVLIRAQDAVTDPVVAWGQVAAGIRALQGIPQVGTLVVNADATGGSTLSAQARRKRFPVKLSSSNVRHYKATLEFVLTSEFGS